MNKLRVSSVVRRQFFSVMVVMTMVELASAVSAMVDGMMAGRLLGPAELAAYGIASPYYSVNAVAIGILLTHFRKKDRLFRFSLKGASWSMVPKILSGGLPRGAAQVCRTVSPILMNGIVLSAAATAGLSAMSVQSSLRTLLRSPITGICSALIMNWSAS